MRAFVIAFAMGLIACAAAPSALNGPSSLTNQTAPAEAAYATPTAADLPEGVYRLDPQRTTVLFRIRSLGAGWITARFDSKTATLELNPADPSRSRLTASVDANSVDTGAPGRKRDRDFDRRIAHALGAERDPHITFASTAIERTGESTARIAGDLTMNGQTHPVMLDATFHGNPSSGAQALGFSAHATINRSQWGVTRWRPFVGNQVQIVIEAALVRA